MYRRFVLCMFSRFCNFSGFDQISEDVVWPEDFARCFATFFDFCRHDHYEQLVLEGKWTTKIMLTLNFLVRGRFILLRGPVINDSF